MKEHRKKSTLYHTKTKRRGEELHTNMFEEEVICGEQDSTRPVLQTVETLPLVIVDCALCTCSLISTCSLTSTCSLISPYRGELYSVLESES